MRIRRRGEGVEVVLSRDESLVVRAAVDQVAALLRPDEAPAGGDPLEQLVGLGSGPVDPPEDPALRRLLPDAYADAAEAAEFRRLMEHDLRRSKLHALEQVSAAVTDAAAGGGKCVVRLSADEAEVWLAALNDVRLTFGTRLDVGEDLDAMVAAMPPDDPRLPLLAAYDWMGLLQDSLVRALDS